VPDGDALDRGVAEEEHLFERLGGAAGDLDGVVDGIGRTAHGLEGDGTAGGLDCVDVAALDHQPLRRLVEGEDLALEVRGEGAAEPLRRLDRAVVARDPQEVPAVGRLAATVRPGGLHRDGDRHAGGARRDVGAVPGLEVEQEEAAVRGETRGRATVVGDGERVRRGAARHPRGRDTIGLRRCQRRRSSHRACEEQEGPTHRGGLRGTVSGRAATY
jgi:hypothetical protein